MPRPHLLVVAFLFACRSSSSSSAATADAAPAATTFEGEIDLSVGPYFVTSKLKGNKSHFLFRRSNGQPMGELYVDGDTNKVYSPIAGRKYAELSIDAVAQQKPLVAKKTGEKDTVLGHECEMLAVVDGQTRRDICLATDLPPLRINVGPTSDGQGYQPSFGQGFPLRISVIDVSQQPKKMEATRIEKKALPDSDVEIHADWPKVLIGPDAGAGAQPK